MRPGAPKNRPDARPYTVKRPVLDMDGGLNACKGTGFSMASEKQCTVMAGKYVKG
jgi:hypothetical protein